MFDMNDPKVQMQLAMAAGLLSPVRGKGMSGFGEALSQGLLGGIRGYNVAGEAQRRNQALDMQNKMQQAQYDQMQGGLLKQKQMDALAPQFFQPGNAPADGMGPVSPPKYDVGGYAQAVTGIDPMKGLGLQAQIAQMGQKELVKAGPGETIGRREGNNFVPMYTAPDKPPPGYTNGPNGLQADPGWLQTQIQLASARRPTVTVNNQQENEFNKTVGKEFGENYANLMKSDAMASGKINKLSRLESLLASSGNTGKLTPPIMELKAAGESLGFKVDPKLPFQQAAQALSNEIALEMRNPSGGAGMPGALSDKDREFLTNMVPNLGKTPEGNKILIDTAKKLSQREKDVARLARDYKKANGKFDEGFYQILGEYSAKNPLFNILEPQANAAPLSQSEAAELEQLRARFKKP